MTSEDTKLIHDFIQIGIWIAGIAATVISGLAVAAILSLFRTTTKVAVLSQIIEKSVIPRLESIPKLEKDINIFHEWKRSIEKEKSNAL